MSWETTFQQIIRTGTSLTLRGVLEREASGDFFFVAVKCCCVGACLGCQIHDTCVTYAFLAHFGAYIWAFLVPCYIILDNLGGILGILAPKVVQKSKLLKQMFR